MKKIENFINQYPLSKTLRFQLIPIGKTEENFEKMKILEADEKRARDYATVKKFLDRYYRTFIERCLNNVQLNGVKDYAELYFKKNRNICDNDEMDILEPQMRNEIAEIFSTDPEYSKLFSKDILVDLLPKVLEGEEEQEIVDEFKNFTTYFYGFFNNRKNIFTKDEKSTGIAFRCINDNLPKYLDNVRTFQNISNYLEDSIKQANIDLKAIYSNIACSIDNLSELFATENFTFVLAQSDIECYNKVIGGYTTDSGTKVQGLNEYINLYNQKNKTKLPLLKPLYKQILSEYESLSFVLDKYETDDEVLEAINSAYTYGESSIQKAVSDINTLFDEIEFYDPEGMHVLSGPAAESLSKAVCGNWNAIEESWNDVYDNVHHTSSGKNEEKYREKRKKEYKKIKSLSFSKIDKLVGKECVTDYYKKTVCEKCRKIEEAYESAKPFLYTPYSEKKRLSKNEEAVERIKEFLDSVKELERSIKPLLGTGKEEYKDETFYAKLLTGFFDLQTIDCLYDKVRNFITKKPYSTDKIKLNFNNVQLLGGWDRNKEKDYCSIILRESGKYYLGILNKGNNNAFSDYPYEAGEEYYEKMVYKLLPDPSKMLPKVFFAKSNIDFYAPSENILKIRKKGSFKKGDTFKIDDCHAMIDFYKNSINRHPEWPDFGFDFSSTKSYCNIGEFFKEVKDQGYRITFDNISKKYIDSLVETGQLYLFQIYCKDFSDYSKGTPNLHTLFFKMLFDEKNLSDVVIKLSGEAEMFYRKASIKDDERVIHPANLPIKNKNPLNEKTESIFEYELIKDKRFTKRSFMFHVPISINFKADGKSYLNDLVRNTIRECEDNYVIGIDRGERNLLYVCVIDWLGRIVEQYSLNQIVNEYDGIKHTTDYHLLLDKKEKERDAARRSWSSVENIKELKEGYLSQVVHKICELVEKYDAVIAMEDLNSGFKNSRKKVEKQVYEKFERALINKLAYMTDKKKNPTEPGGILKGYQLANNDPKYIGKGTQNGIIFYVPAWLTSKIDPVTGFVNLLDTRYLSVEKAKEFFGLFDKIGFNTSTGMFEFTFDYSKFPKGVTSYRKDWTVCSNGTRIRSFRNPEKNNEWDNETIVLTDEFTRLFEESEITVSADMKEAICGVDKKEFFERLLYLLRLTLQMRNSETGNVEIDYLISPVKDAYGRFYDSRNYEKEDNADFPKNADANGAYNIARKGLHFINLIKQSSEEKYKKEKLTITNKEWLKYAQKND